MHGRCSHVVPLLQANYSAANAALDTATADMAARGMRSVSMQWGAWAGAGMACPKRPEDAGSGAGSSDPRDGSPDPHTGPAGHCRPPQQPAGQGEQHHSHPL